MTESLPDAGNERSVVRSDAGAQVDQKRKPAGQRPPYHIKIIKYFIMNNLVRTWAAPVRTRSTTTPDGWYFAINGIINVDNDEIDTTKARNNFGPMRLTITDARICVNA